MESEGRREALLELLHRIKLRPQEKEHFIDALKSDEKFTLVIGQCEHGFAYQQRFALICESDMLGDRVIQRRKKEKRSINSDTVIRNLAELKPGQPVVHIDHGIGRYVGLQTLEAGGMMTEYVTLEYQNDAKLYVPVASLNLIGRYSGGADESAPLNKLGSESWAKHVEKRQKKCVMSQLNCSMCTRNAN